jgi:hypothetical protein
MLLYWALAFLPDGSWRWNYFEPFPPQPFDTVYFNTVNLDWPRVNLTPWSPSDLKGSSLPGTVIRRR